ncbi:MAG TPA: deoxyribodipyrimidine photo-lyase [Bacteroidales bacterium]|nr:deoxyribodipyrimidine photo-lyase [Bacteroidales bacterium]HSA42690.1 deoxyribodipyrimidine photo-lyase [Bacteroidales bacterium]
MMEEVCIFWFRRDLRLHDNKGLDAALASGFPVLCLFIFDKNILDSLPEDDPRLTFIHGRLETIREMLEQRQSTLLVLHQTPEEAFTGLLKVWNVSAVYANHDYEPYARQRDENISTLLNKTGVAFHTCKDQVVFERNEIAKADGTPYTVYTPYARKWLVNWQAAAITISPTGQTNFLKTDPFPVPSLIELGFRPVLIHFPSAEIPVDIISRYDLTRDYPALEGTSRLGLHLRFGTISIRELALKAAALNTTYLRELIWREFFMMILYHFPHVEHKSFRSAYDFIAWRNHPEEFRAWQEGRTGYPLVDAGMRELNETGYMHNRVRMITSSFLCKNLLTDWRLGEATFASKLLDYELASNNGNWQWAAGTGCDAAPYFRFFNPLLQQQKYDPELVYIKKWVPEYGTNAYPQPITGLKESNARCLEAYRKATGRV